MASQNMLIGAKPLVAQFVKRHFPDEGWYFEILWAALGDRLASMDSCKAGTAGHPLNLGGLSFAGDGAVPVQKSLEVIRILADAIPVFGSVPPGEEVVRNFIAEKAAILRSERPVLDALAKLLVEMLGSGETAAARIRIDFLPRCVMVRNPGSGQTTQHGLSSPWRLLAYLCCHIGRDVHWACGLEVFPEWQKAEGRPGRQSFSEHRSRLTALLKDISPDRWPLAELGYGAGLLTRIERCRFESNVFDAKAMSHEATVLFHGGKFAQAKEKAQEALKVWEASQEAFQTFLACLNALDFGKLPVQFLKDVLRQVHLRATVLRGVLGRAERLDDDVLRETGELLGSWHAEMSQLVRTERQLADWLKVETDTPSEFTPAHALIDSIERLRSTTDACLKARLQQDIVGSAIYQAAKRRSSARLREVRRKLYERNEEDVSQDQDVLFLAHITEGARVASVNPRKIESFLASMMTHDVLAEWYFREHGVNASDQRELRKLWYAREKLFLVEQVRPSVEDLARVMGCPEARVRELLDLDRLCDTVDHVAED